jgi:hypothetical protein
MLYLEAGVGVGVHPALVSVVVVVGQPGAGLVPRAAHCANSTYFSTWSAEGTGQLI